MYALTLTQPWASLIAHRIKTIENRTWAPPRCVVGERIAIHASGRHDLQMENTIRYVNGWCPPAPLGVLVATAVVAGVAQSEASVPDGQKRWFTGPWAWVLEDIYPCTRFALRGNQGVWHLGGNICKRLDHEAKTFAKLPKGCRMLWDEGMPRSGMWRFVPRGWAPLGPHLSWAVVPDLALIAEGKVQLAGAVDSLCRWWEAPGALDNDVPVGRDPIDFDPDERPELVQIWGIV